MNEKTTPSIAIFYILYFIFSSADVNACTANTTISRNIDFGNVSVGRDAPVGSVIARVEIPSDGTNLARCRYNPYFIGLGAHARALIIPGVYPTGANGLGIRGGIIGGGNEVLSNPIEEVQYNDASRDIFNTRAQYFELIKTGNITSNSISFGGFAHYTLRSRSGTVYPIIYSVRATIAISSCSVLNSNINVDFGRVKLQGEWAGVGSTSAIQGFNIPLSCGSDTPVSITLNNINPLADEANGVLNINSGSTAKGVGVQVLHKNNPVRFGQVINYGKTTGGNINIPFEARLYQISDKVSPGVINSSATFTVTYM